MQNKSKKTEESRINVNPNQEINNHEEVINNSPYIDQNTFDEHPEKVSEFGCVPTGLRCLLLVIIILIGFYIYFYF